MNRWVVVAGALLIQVALGAVYIWSVFKGPLMDEFGWSPAATNLTFSITLLVCAMATVVFGKLQDRVGPRSVATIGGLLLALGLILAGRASSLGWLYFSFGVLGGAGMGAGYVCPLATCVKWFPDKRGLISGLAVAGFGGGALVFTPIAKGFIAASGVLATFTYLGLIIGASVVLGARLLVNPPPGYQPAGWAPAAAGAGAGAGAMDYTTRQMVRTSQFYMIWISYLFGCAAGLMIISNALPIAEAQGLSGALAAGAVMTVSVFNAAGRLAWGAVSDRLGRTRTLTLVFLVCGLTMLSLKLLSGPAILIGVSLVGFCFGGFLGVYPTITADYFGTRNLGMNYGSVFMAFGLGAVFGPMLYDLLKSPVPGALGTLPLMVSGVLCLAAMGLMLLLRPPLPRR